MLVIIAQSNVRLDNDLRGAQRVLINFREPFYRISLFLAFKPFLHYNENTVIPLNFVSFASSHHFHRGLYLLSHSSLAALAYTLEQLQVASNFFIETPKTFTERAKNSPGTQELPTTKLQTK